MTEVVKKNYSCEPEAEEIYVKPSKLDEPNINSVYTMLNHAQGSILSVLII